jgi:hypothetical protein
MPPKTISESCCGNNFAKKNTSTIPAKDHAASTIRNKNLGGGGRSFLTVFQSKTMLNSPSLPCARHQKTPTCTAKPASKQQMPRENRKRQQLKGIEPHLENGSPGEIRTLVGGSKARYACPLHSAERCSSLHRASPG